MNAQAHIRNETNELRLLFEVCRALEASGDLSRQMAMILDLMTRHTAMLWGGITLTEPERNGPTPAPWKKESWLSLLPNDAPGKHPAAEHHDALEAAVLGSGLPVAVLAGLDSPLPLHRSVLRALNKEEAVFFGVPMVHAGRTMGAIFADRLFADSVAAEEDARLLHIISSLIAQALNVRIELEARHAAVIEENRRLQALIHEQFLPVGMVGNSAALQAVFSELTHVADSNTTVLILGESGTGKELAAEAIHANSSRMRKPFIRLNCAALPEGLVESELFGHERGAFTGATEARKGRFEQAHEGTLFLDEIGDLTAMTQAKLLRVLQEKEFERVGGARTIRVDVRLIAATNRDLEHMVAEGSFRQDLYYRLSVFPILLPPLRRRREDIMPLATHFAEKYGRESGRNVRRISAEATNLLTAYPWPGNIRELENVMERAVLLCGPAGIIEAAHLPPALQGEETEHAAEHGPLDAALSALERRLIAEALNDARGNMVKAARQLGITERIMGLRMKKYSLNFKDFRTRH